jgi:hypothetical protein
MTRAPGNPGPAPRPGADGSDGSADDFVDTWSAALVNPRPRLYRPARGLRGVVVLVGAAVAVTGLAVAAVAVPRTMPRIGFVSSGQKKPQAVAPIATPSPTPSPSPSPTHKKKKKPKPKPTAAPPAPTYRPEPTPTPTPTRTKKPKSTKEPVPPAPRSLKTGQTLGVGARLASSNGKYELVMQSNGNLVLFGRGKTVIWSTGTGTAGSVLLNQQDGNLVVVTPDDKPVWAAMTQGHDDTVLTLQNDGNLVIYEPVQHALWATNTAR